jgi:hypothetical protein
MGTTHRSKASTDSVILIQALIRVIIFIAVAGVVTFLSMHCQRAEELLLETNRQLESEVEERKKAEEEKENLIFELQQTSAEVKILRGILPICSFCKKLEMIRGTGNRWRFTSDNIQMQNSVIVFVPSVLINTTLNSAKKMEKSKVSLIHLAPTLPINPEEQQEVSSW